MTEPINKKILLFVIIVAVAIFALGLYLLLRGRSAPRIAPAVPIAAPAPAAKEPATAAEKMQILQQLTALQVPAAERKQTLRALAH